MLLTEQLNELTAEHIRILEESRTYWRSVGLSVAPVNKPAAKAGLDLAYRSAELQLPNIIIWLKSPRAGATACRLLASDLEWPANLNAAQSEVWDDVWKQALRQVEALIGPKRWAEERRELRRISEQHILKKNNGLYIEKHVKEEFSERLGILVWRYLRELAGEPKFEQIRTQVEETVQATVREQVPHEIREVVFQELVTPIRQQVWATIGEAVRQMITANNGVLAGRQTWHCGFGHLDSSWIAFYDYLRSLGTEGTKPLDGIKQLTENSGWWWPYENLCFMTGRPVEVHRDNRGRLHNESGMAIRYADGWGFYAWQGILVPEYVILLPEPITTEMINAEPNAEVRRVLIERFGLDNYLKEGTVLKVHQDVCGTLYRMNLRGDEPILVVRVVNSTPEPDGSYNEYFLRVPPNILRARQAVAWTFGLTEEEYEPLAET
jgi:hypothetical protein